MKVFHAIIPLAVLLFIVSGCKLLGGPNQSESNSSARTRFPEDFASPSPTPTNPLAVYQSNSKSEPTPAPVSAEELTTLFPMQIGSFTRTGEPKQASGPHPYGSIHQLVSFYKTSGVPEDIIFSYYKFSMPSYQKTSSTEQAKDYMNKQIEDATTPDTSVPITSDVTRYRLVSRKPITDGEVVYLRNLPKYAKSEQVWIRTGDVLREVLIMNDKGNAEEFANAYLSQ